MIHDHVLDLMYPGQQCWVSANAELLEPPELAEPLHSMAITAAIAAHMIEVIDTTEAHPSRPTPPP